MCELMLRAVAGPPWDEPTRRWVGHAANNERALLAMLRGEPNLAETLLRERHQGLAASGSTYQRYNFMYPGSLVAALGPPDTDPAVDWLESQIFEPAFPNRWIVHRAI